MMASESDELPVTPELTDSSGVEIRRHSDGKASSRTSVKKHVPNYLRASTGSCHDFCKYGRKHASELKDRRSIPNRATRKQLHNSLEGCVGGTKMSVVWLNASVDSKPTKMSTLKLKESVDSKTWNSDTSDTNSTLEQSTNSLDNQKEIGKGAMANRNESSLVKAKSSTKEIRSSSNSASIKVGTSSKTTSRYVEAPSKLTTNKMEILLKSTSNKMGNPSKSNSKVKTSSKPTSNMVKPSSQLSSSLNGREIKLSEQRVTSLNSSIVRRKQISSTNSSDGISGQRYNKTKLERGASSSKAVSTKLMTPSKASLSPKPSSQLSSLNGKEIKLSEQHVTSLNSSSVRRKQISSTNSSDGISGQRYNKIKLERGDSSSKAASKKLMAPSKALLTPKASLIRVASINSRKHKSLKIASYLKSQPTARKVEHEEHNNNELEEKTLYVIKMENENKTLQSDQNVSYDNESYLPQLSSPKSSLSSISQSLSQEDQEGSEYTTSEFEQDSVSENHEIECMENKETLEVEKKGKSKKVRVVYSKDKDNKMIKLKFRRGTILENQTEMSRPRRLKFRRARVQGDKASVEGGMRKSFESNEACDDSNGATTGEKVVLRHQDMQDKKDSQGLLNNVIEETASKLVEAQKSKVKALVGAFETVISLHEKKPSANTLLNE